MSRMGKPWLKGTNGLSFTLLILILFPFPRGYNENNGRGGEAQKGVRACVAAYGARSISLSRFVFACDEGKKERRGSDEQSRFQYSVRNYAKQRASSRTNRHKADRGDADGDLTRRVVALDQKFPRRGNFAAGKEGRAPRSTPSVLHTNPG